MNEPAYLELKGMIIDWAMQVFPSEPAMEPREVIVMLERMVREFEEVSEK